MSLVLNGKRPLSGRAARRIAEQLSLSAEESRALLKWAEAKPRKRGQVESQLTDALSNETNVYQMSLDSFALVSDWFHYAILSLLEIPGCRFEAKWIARHLGINEIEAKSAMERLQRMGLVVKKGARWRQAVSPIRIGNNVPTGASKKFQKQLMLKAIESIENDPNEIRDFSSMTLAMDPAQIPYAREQIRKFRRKLTAELEALGAPSCVYEFTVQIFPVSKPQNKSEKSK